MDYARSFAHSESLMDFIQKPPVILRSITTFLMMLVFSCILDKGYDSAGVCHYHGNNGACNFTVGISVIAFFIGIGLLVATYFWDQISNTVTRKYIIFSDMAFCGLWSFFFFVDFCFITDMWRKTPDATKSALSGIARSNLQFTIVCSLVCIFLLAMQCYMAYKQMNDIQNDASGLGGYNDAGAAGFGGNASGGAYAGQPFPPHTESAAGTYQGPYAQ